MIGLDRLRAWWARRQRPPSGTAAAAARNRAVHQILDRPVLVHDAFALALYGDTVRNELAAGWQDTGDARAVRAMHAIRSRFFRDEAAAARDTGVRQYLALGAGLDDFCITQPPGAWDVQVELDRGPVLAWKRRALRRHRMPVPAELKFVPADLVQDDWYARVVRAGVDPARPVLVNWQGVSQYLTEAQNMEILDRLATFPNGTRVVLDTRLAPARLAPAARAQLEGIMRAGARRGEHWQSFLEPERLERELRARGFTAVSWFDTEALAERYAGDAGAALPLLAWPVLGVAVR